jgi:hypothetical protein
MASVDAAVAEAMRDVSAAISGEYARRDFTITKFGRHRDGFLHAQVTLSGDRFYVHCKHGSWLLPVPNNQPESNRYREVMTPFREALAEKGAQFKRRERLHREEVERANQTANG